METIRLNNSDVLGTVSTADIESWQAKAETAIDMLENGTGEGNGYLGWLHLPSTTTDELVDEIAAASAELRKKCEFVVTIGIGGSYLGAKSVIEALSDTFAAYKTSEGAKVLFAGQNIGEEYLYELMQLLEGKEFGIVVFAKSGTTTEPAIAFRILKEMLDKQVGKAEAAKRIIAITDASKGALRTLATEEGYKTFVIPGNVGGRFSVLTPVGLVPIAVAGFDVKAFVAGARAMEAATANTDPANPVIAYAKTRNALYAAGKKIEILVNFHPKLHYVSEWWKQLYGESEGKDHKGIFPASVDDTTDLHSMGQWIQDGERTIFETVITVEKQQKTLVIPTDEANLDCLNYIAGKRVDEVNKMAELGTRLAHIDGGVPTMVITMPEINENYLGQLIYFFEKACGVSGYLLGVNPFNQPGVEAYKKNMFALLNKPGYEAESAAIQAKLAK